MTRNVTAGFLSAAGGSTCSPVLLFEGVFSSGTLRLWNGIGDLSWNSQTWQGNGILSGFRNLKESIQIDDLTWGVTLSGVPAAMVAIALGGIAHNGSGKIWIAFFSGGSLVADPYLWTEGLLDTAKLEDGAADAELTIDYSTVIDHNDRTKEYKYSHETQKLFYPTDTGFNFIKSTLEWGGWWGKTKKKLKAQEARREKNAKAKKESD